MDTQTKARLATRWNELRHDRALRDTACKVQLGAAGDMEFSPISTRRARLMASVSFALAEHLREGDSLISCSVMTERGVRVPDVAWASSMFLAETGDATPFVRAPEICVEVCPYIGSQVYTDGDAALVARDYINSGAREYWVVSEAGEVAVFDRTGRQMRTRYAVTLALPPRMRPQSPATARE